MLYIVGLVVELEKSLCGDFGCKRKKELVRCPLLLKAKVEDNVQEVVHYNLKVHQRNTAAQIYRFDQSFVYFYFDANFPTKY